MMLLHGTWGRQAIGVALIVVGAALLYMGATTGLQWALAVSGAFSRPSPAAAALLRNMGLLDVLAGTALVCAGRWVAQRGPLPQTQAR